MTTVLLLLAPGCGGSSKDKLSLTDAGTDAATTGVITTDGGASGKPFSVNASGVVQNDVLFGGPDGTSLHLYAGTHLAIRGLDEGTLLKPTDVLLLSATLPAATDPPLPQEYTTLARLRVVLTLNGKEIEADFTAPATSVDQPQVRAPNAGLKITVDLASSADVPPTTGTLFKLSGTNGVAMPVATTLASLASTSPLTKGLHTAVHGGRLAGPPGNGGTMSWPAPGTGSYGAGSPKQQGSAGTVPQGLYYSLFTIPPAAPCVDLAGTPYCQESEVGQVLIVELSTAEILTECDFRLGDTLSNRTADGDIFWCERSFSGSNTMVKISSERANLPVLHVIYRIKPPGDGMWQELLARPDGGVLHTPSGGSNPNPYEDTSLTFAGFKQFILNVPNWTVADEAVQKMRQAGYQAHQFRYDKGVTLIDVNHTKDGRARIAQKVLEGQGWTLLAARTTGNVGAYSKDEPVVVDVTSHSNGQSVKTRKVTLSGTINFPYADMQLTELTITRIAILTMDKQEYRGTITQASSTKDGATLLSFTADIELGVGSNTLTFWTKGTDKDKRETAFSTQTKIKGVAAAGLTLIYDAGWSGTVSISRKTTITEPAPYQKSVEHQVDLTGSFGITISQTKLSYIQSSHANAVSCAGIDGCFLFESVLEGSTVGLNESSSTQSACEPNGPMQLTSTFSGGNTANYPQWALKVAAQLTPWTSASTSEMRGYHLYIRSASNFSVSSDPAWLTGTQKSLDCTFKTWSTTTSSVGGLSGITVDRKDDPILLPFPDPAALEAFVAAPSGSKSWTLRGTRTSSSDNVSQRTDEYTVTLTISPG